MINLPIIFKDKYRRLLGAKKAEEFFKALQKTPRKAFRVNLLKINLNKVKGHERVPFIPNAFYGKKANYTPEWISGTVYSQDVSAMFPAYFAQVKPGQRVLDLCAAPGGKSTAIATALDNQGLLVANEISRSRSKVLRENSERWGFRNVVITNTSPKHLSTKFKQYFDTILVDAPCSGEGMFSKSQTAIKDWSEDYVLTCQKRQKQILTQALKMLKPGGKLVYSTCTFSPEEDEEIVVWLIQKYGLKLQKAPHSSCFSHGCPEWTKPNLKVLKRAIRFWPQEKFGAGQFTAILKLSKSENSTPTSQSTLRSRKYHDDRRKKSEGLTRSLTSKEIDFINSVLSSFNLPTILINWKKSSLVSKNHVFCPALNPDFLKGIRILSNGVELGLLKKNRFEPGHQLAEILGTKKQKKVINLKTKKSYRHFLHGESLKVNSKLRGFTLVAFAGFIFSFGKIGENSVLKNFYPKGLRILKETG